MTARRVAKNGVRVIRNIASRNSTVVGRDSGTEIVELPEFHLINS